MKKLLFTLSFALLLVACGEETVKEETPVVEAKEEVNPIDEVIRSVTKNKYEIKQSEGIVSITIEDEKLHEGSKRAILNDSAEIFAGLSKIEGITAPTIKWTSILTDQYGNESIGEILSIMLDADTFAKINWANYKTLDIEALAYGFKQHETLKD